MSEVNMTHKRTRWSYETIMFPRIAALTIRDKLNFWLGANPNKWFTQITIPHSTLKT